jgi:hypothetical protein
MGYWKRYHKRKSLVTNWRIVRYLNGMSETKFKVQYKGYFGFWITHKMMMGYDGSHYTVWYDSYTDARKFIDTSILHHKNEFIRSDVDVDIINFK